MNRPQELGILRPIEVVPLMGRPTWAETYAGGSTDTTHNMYFASRYNHNKHAQLEMPPRLWSSCSEPLLLRCDLDSPPPPSPLSPGIPSSPPPPQLPSSHRTSSTPGSRQIRPRNRDGETEEERKRMSIVVGICATSIFVTAFLLVAITLRMTPQIDEMIRKENEELLKILQSGGGAVNSRPENSTGPPRTSSLSSSSSSLTPPPISEG